MNNEHNVSQQIFINTVGSIRLDKFLRIHFKDKVSRAQIQRLIKSGSVRIEGRFPKNVHEFLRGGEHIACKPLALNKEEKAERLFSISDIHILYRDDDYFIVEKPSGLLVHAISEIERNGNSLAELLCGAYPEISAIGENGRNGLVHRLDKNVSGVMAVARSNEMYIYLKEQFKERKVRKEYLALVHGDILKDEGEIRFLLSRSKRSGKIAAKPATSGDESAKSAVTEFLVKKRFKDFTYLLVTLKTGRTHQIRVHLSAYGHPVVGDTLYKRKFLKTRVKLDRMFLHSHLLGFFDLKGVWKEFVSPLPKELADILSVLPKPPQRAIS